MNPKDYIFDIPTKIYPDKNWPHYDLWVRVSDLIYALPNYFETELIIRGINVTEVFSVGIVFATIIETQVVAILNQLRTIWDPDNNYTHYIFIRQSQTFPDVLLRNVENELDIIFGLELKSWYVLSKEAEPSFRYKIDPEACAIPDMLIIIPWLLSEVISGTPKLLTPYCESAKYAAEYRNYYWQKSRLERHMNYYISRPPKSNQHPYPISKQESSDEAQGDKGGNFGRIARCGVLDEFNTKIKAQDYLGVKIIHWINFFKAISETTTDQQISKKIEEIKSQILKESTYNIEKSNRQHFFLNIIEQIELLWQEIA